VRQREEVQALPRTVEVRLPWVGGKAGHCVPAFLFLVGVSLWLYLRGSARVAGSSAKPRRRPVAAPSAGRPVPAAPELPGRQPAIGAFAKLAGWSVPRTDHKRPAQTVAHLPPRWLASDRRTPTAPGATTGRRLTRRDDRHCQPFASFRSSSPRPCVGRYLGLGRMACRQCIGLAAGPAVSRQTAVHRADHRAARTVEVAGARTR
jgi:hypothetical protein